MAPTQPVRKVKTMLQIKDLSESELILALAAITETAADIATRLRVIKSEEISSDEYNKFVDTELTFFRRLMYFYYDNADIYIAEDTQDIINTYRKMNELF